jgi:hypothetical protein
MFDSLATDALCMTLLWEVKCKNSTCGLSVKHFYKLTLTRFARMKIHFSLSRELLY